MSVDLHREAERLMGEADIAERGREFAKAADKRCAAAILEESVYRALPADRSRTRGIIAVSAVSLFFKAGEFGEVRRLGEELARAGLPAYHTEQILDMLEEVEFARH